jgi:hypothetical protein
LAGGEVRRGLLAAALIATALVLGAANASAQPLAGVVADIPTGGHIARSAPSAHVASLIYFNGPVMHSNRTHLIFWEPSGSGLRFDPGYEALIEAFMSQVAADSRTPTNVYALSGQYQDGNGPAAYDSQYAGGVLDTDPLPGNGCTEPPLTGPGWTVCVSGAQIDNELQRFVAANHLPTGAPDLYFLLTPNGLGSCMGSGPTNCALGGSAAGYCGYHDDVAGGTLKFAVIPYNAVTGHCQSGDPRPNGSTADPALSTISHEHIESVTDPFHDAWIAPSGSEIGDVCIDQFGPPLGGAGSGVYNQVIHGGHYFLQDEWSNDDGGCAARDEADRASFATRGRLRTNKRVRFSAHGSDPDGTLAAYLWSFGDGRSTHHRVVRHKYKKRGTYTVTLRVTDSDGNWAFSTRTIVIR